MSLIVLSCRHPASVRGLGYYPHCVSHKSYTLHELYMTHVHDSEPVLLLVLLA